MFPSQAEMLQLRIKNALEGSRSTLYLMNRSSTKDPHHNKKKNELPLHYQLLKVTKRSALWSTFAVALMYINQTWV